MKVSIIGAGRTRNGIGEYIGKYFHQHGGQVISALGTSEKTTLQACSALRKYGINAHPYTRFDEMVKNEKPEVMVIASPSSTHYEYLLQSIDSGAHVFCEKPFIWTDRINPSEAVEEIFGKARSKGLIVAMNSQWPFALDDYKKICGKVKIEERNTFFIEMAPPVSGRKMISESVPHALSLLYCLLGDGEIENLRFESKEERAMSIRFTYLFGTKTCDVFIQLAYQEAQPRPFSFGLNGQIVSRSLDFENYETYFNYENKKMRITDPLESSVKDFMEAFATGNEPFIGAQHIFHNLSLLKKIDDEFGAFEKRNPWKR
ncbi:MAG: Gfo/Idh/MocA family oxidoreductase [Syntrophaceae bacterium]|nr:Gfo/Idh/MocA family oxidoreductase [Syntrophaceae bacterium]